MNTFGRLTIVIAGLVLAGCFTLMFASAGEHEEKEKYMEPRDDKASLSGVRVAVLIGEEFQDAEALMPMAYLANRGAKVKTVGLKREMVTAYNSSIRLLVEHEIADLSAEDFDALVIPGGRSPTMLREHREVVAFVEDFIKRNKPIAAICLGPQLLVAAGALKDRKATGFPSISQEITNAGGEYHDSEVVVDGNIITSRSPKDIPAFCEAIEKALKTRMAER